MNERRTGRAKLLLDIFLVFLRIGPVTFGGGFAMIPVIEKEVVERKRWMQDGELADILAMAQAVPGAVAINSAMFVGYRLSGVLGAIVAMIGVLLPTFTIILLLSAFFLRIQHNAKIEAAFVAIRATVVAIITFAAIKIGKTAAIDKTSTVLILVSVVSLFFLHMHPIFLILAGGAAGIGIMKCRQLLKRPVVLERTKTASYKYEDYFIGEGI